MDHRELSFDSIQRDSKSSVVLQLLQRQAPSAPSLLFSPTRQQQPGQGFGFGFNDQEPLSYPGPGVKLKGQFIILDQGQGEGAGPVALFLGSPLLSGLDELKEQRLTLSDLSLADKVSAL